MTAFTPMDDAYLKDFYHALGDMAAGFEDAAEIGPHTRSRVGDTPLHIAAIRGDIRAVALLLDVGADINARGEKGYTALHYAVDHEHPEVVGLLLERGADKEIRLFDGQGQTADELAHDASIINDEIIALLENLPPKESK